MGWRIREWSLSPSHGEGDRRRKSTAERRRHRNPKSRVELRVVTGVGEKQIDGEAMVERGESSRLHPSTAAETAGARRNRPATTEAIRGSRRPRERVREEGEERVGQTGSDRKSVV